jgi:hypothetical protein
VYSQQRKEVERRKARSKEKKREEKKREEGVVRWLAEIAEKKNWLGFSCCLRGRQEEEGEGDQVVGGSGWLVLLFSF